MAFYTPQLAHGGYDVVMLRAASSPETDGNWAEQDGSVRVETGGGKVKSLWSFEHSSDIYVATQQETDGRVRLHIFDPGTDTWTTKNEYVAAIGDSANFTEAPINAGVTISVRSDGDVIVALVGASSGTDDVFYIVRTGATWGTLTLIQALGDNPIAMGPDSSDRITLLWHSSLSGTHVKTQSLSSTDVEGTLLTIDSAIDTASLLLGPGVIDSGNEIYAPYIDSTDKISVVQFTSAADPTGDITIHADVGDNTVWRHGGVDTGFDTLDAGTITNFDFGNTANYERLAQSFSIGGRSVITGLWAKIRIEASPTDGIFVEIQSDSSGQPSETVLFTSDTVDFSDIDDHYGPVKFTFSTPPALEASTTYWIVFNRTGSLNATNLYNLARSGDNISGGSNYFTSGSWQTIVSTDFEILMIAQASLAACLAVDGTNVHLLYADDTDQDVQHDSDVDGGGTTDVELVAGTCSRISCNVLGTNLDYVWLDGTTIKYGSEALADAVFPTEFLVKLHDPTQLRM